MLRPQTFAALICFAVPLIAHAQTVRSNAETAHPQPTVSCTLDYIPDDVFVVVHTSNLSEMLVGPLMEMYETWANGSPLPIPELPDLKLGSCSFGLSGLPFNPPGWSITLACETQFDHPTLLRHLEQNAVPAINNLMEFLQAEPATFTHDERIGTFILTQPIPQTIYIACRDGLIYGTTDYAKIELFADDNLQADDGFPKSNEYKRVTQEITVTPDLFFWLDARMLIPLAYLPLTETAPNLYETFQLGNIESLALVTHSPKAEGPDEKGKGKKKRGHVGRFETQIIRLAIGFSTMPNGAWHFLASKPAKPSLAQFYPKRTNFLLQGAAENLNVAAEDLATVVSGFAPEIVAEFRKECLEFARDVGFSPQAQFLGNLGPRWAIGGRLGSEENSINVEEQTAPTKPSIHEGLIAIELKSEENFLNHIRLLKAAYRLEMTTTQYKNTTIVHALRNNGQFSYAVNNGVLLMAHEPQTIANAIDAAGRGRNLIDSLGYERMTYVANKPVSKFLFVDVAKIAHVLYEEDGDFSEELLALAQSQTTVALTVQPHERMIAFELVSQGISSDKVIDAIARSITASFDRARDQAKRTTSMNNIRMLLTSCMAYANENENEMPSALTAEVITPFVGSEETAAKILFLPYDPEPKVPYLYKPINIKKITELARVVVIAEPFMHNGGACFGFADGRVEWIKGERARRLLAGMKH